MVALLIKILLVLSGACMAVTSIGFSTLEPLDEEQPRPWWRRLTLPGYVAVGAALVTMLLGILNEVLASHEAANLKRQNEALQTRVDTLIEDGKNRSEVLDDSRQLLNQTIGHLRRQRDRTQMLERALEQSKMQKAFARISLVDAPSIIGDVRDNKGRGIEPQPDDVLRWKISCSNGPPIQRNDWPKGCKDYSYGSLFAYQQRLVLDSVESSAGVAYNRGPRTVLSIELPDGNCAEVRRSLSQNLCHIDLWHESTGRQTFLEVLSERGYDSYDPEVPLESDLCRAYQLLYGESCEALIEQSESRVDRYRLPPR